MLQNNHWTGLFFLTGIFYGSFTMGVAAMLSTIVGTLTAKYLKYNPTEIGDGIYGFSASLIGVALALFYQPSVLIWISIIVGSSLAAIIQHFFISKKLPAFTFPFIVITWIFLGLFSIFPPIVLPQPGAGNVYSDTLLKLFSNAFGQVIFQSDIVSGILFFIGILINRPIAAIYAVAGVIISSLLAHYLHEPADSIYLGLMSYNAVLCALAFAGKKMQDAILVFISVILSVLIMVLMKKMDLPALTFPFVLATWLTLIFRTIKKRTLK